MEGEDTRGCAAGMRELLDDDLVFVSTFPVTIPFMVMGDAVRAMRWSNAIAVVLLFVAGYSFGRISGRHPLGFGIGMVVFGLLIVAMTIALGG